MDASTFMPPCFQPTAGSADQWAVNGDPVSQRYDYERWMKASIRVKCFRKWKFRLRQMRPAAVFLTNSPAAGAKLLVETFPKLEK